MNSESDFIFLKKIIFPPMISFQHLLLLFFLTELLFGLLFLNTQKELVDLYYFVLKIFLFDALFFLFQLLIEPYLFS